MDESAGTVQRKLVAILAADIAGYSGLMESDEVGTVHALNAHRQIFDGLIAQNRGRIANTAGDSILAEFPSAVDAVRCAIEAQRQLVSNIEGAGLQFRIGVHVGDVIVQGGDLLGDGVNLAARLESIADPGGICISEVTYGYVRKALPLSVIDLGIQNVKNLRDPVRVFAVQTASSKPSKPVQSATLPVPDKPSIVVLPFQNLSGAPDQEYFADGITEDLLTGLSRIRWMFVIGRNSSFAFRGAAFDIKRIGAQLGVRYALEGSVRKAGNRIRITSQLIDTSTATQLWADRFDGELTEIFDLQDAITESVVAAIEPTVRRAEIDRVKRKRPDDLGVYDLYLRAIAHMYETRPEGREAALGFVTRALQIEPSFAEAHGVAAWCYFAKSLWEGSLPAPHREAMLRHARAVQELQSEDASTLAHAAIALALATRDYSLALGMIDRAIAINPSSAHAHGHGSVISTWAGEYDRSIELSDHALRLSPFDPLSVMPLAGQAGARLMRGEFAEALAFARRGLQIYPSHTPSTLIAIVSLMLLGKAEEARATAADFMHMFPSYRIIPGAPVFEHFTAQLSGAGLPG